MDSSGERIGVGREPVRADSVQMDLFPPGPPAQHVTRKTYRRG